MIRQFLSIVFKLGNFDTTVSPPCLLKCCKQCSQLVMKFLLWQVKISQSCLIKPFHEIFLSISIPGTFLESFKPNRLKECARNLDQMRSYYAQDKPNAAGLALDKITFNKILYDFNFFLIFFIPCIKQILKKMAIIATSSNSTVKQTSYNSFFLDVYSRVRNRSRPYSY